MLAGRRVPRIDEIVIDRVLAHDLRVGLGDRLVVGDVRLRVGGIADGGNAVVGSYAFVSAGTLAAGGVHEPGHLFAEVAPGHDPATVGARLAAIPGLRVRSRDAFVAQNQALARQLLVPLIAILATVSAVVGGAIVALVLHASAVEHRTDWGLLSAIGLSAARLVGTVVWQAVIATAFGVAAGLAAARLLAAALPLVEPRFVTLIPLWLDGLVAVVATAIGLVASVAPVRAVAAVDPGEVFRA
jgi:putative ABC transport system permease protein